MTATIEINGLRIFAHHGVLPQESVVGNEFELTVHLDYPCQEAMSYDKLSGTLNYADIILLLKAEMARPSKLLEHVVTRIHTRLTTAYPQVTGGLITLKKIHPPVPAQLASAAFTLRW